MDYNYIATAVFSSPAIGHCGLNEDEAREKYNSEIDIYKTSFTPLRYALGGSKHKTFYKLIVDRKTQKVVGGHIVDQDAGEVIQLLSVCMKAGLTKAQFDATIGVHPTSTEELVTMREPVNDTL